jgi:hypothetical protein
MLFSIEIANAPVESDGGGGEDRGGRRVRRRRETIQVWTDQPVVGVSVDANVGPAPDPLPSWEPWKSRPPLIT